MKLWTATLYLLARWEVLKACLSQQTAEENVCGDLLPASLIPSVAMGNCRDRVLADIDQDGFIFALDELDARLFNSRQTMVPRRHHRVQIVLTKGFVRIRKSVLRKANASVFARLRDFAQWELYLEAAALLRLRGLDGVPSIRRLDPRQGMIETDYIWGPDLRQIFSEGRYKINYKAVSSQFSALLAKRDNKLSHQIADLLTSVMARGVIHRDIDAANFIRGRCSGKLYLVDFNLIYLRPVPGWRSHVRDFAS